MNQNYSINHKLLQFPVFQEKLTTTEHQALLITFSFIVHWCGVNGGTCEFKQNGLSGDWRIKKDYFKKSRDLLVKYKLIEEIKSYSQRDGHGYFYKLGTGYTSLAKNLYLMGTKAVPPRGTVNNNNNYYRGSGANTPSPNLKNVFPETPLTPEEIALKKKQMDEKALELNKRYKQNPK